MSSRFAVLALSTLATLAPTASLRAQAWVPSSGQGTVTLASQVIDNTAHIQTDGTQPFGKSRSAAVYLEVDYGITDRLSVSVGIPFVFARYLGPRPPAGIPEPAAVQPHDACYCWQNGWADFGATTRLALLQGPTAVTSSIAFSLPSHAYDYRGEAVVGRQLREVRLAVDVGRRLDSISSRLAAQGRYSYAIVERKIGIGTNRSNIVGDLLYQVSDGVLIRGGVMRQVTHGGMRALGPPTPVTGYPWGEIQTEQQFVEHDRLMRDNQWRVSAGVSWDLSRAALFASFIEYTGGTDTHDGRALSVGVSVPFTVGGNRP